uniref:Helix-turn-helix DNA binding domain protein n=1 Tax=Mycobacterium phage Pharb TaxID=3136626 RepID=A0AAU8GPJ6_9VIRU
MTTAEVAERRARKRDERSRIAANTGVLDLFKPRVGEVATADEVCRLLRIEGRGSLRNVINRHGDELAADGWDRATNTFTRRAIIRVALMLRPSSSPRAGRIAMAAKAGSKVISFNHAPLSRMTQGALDRAYELAAQVRDDDPGEVWAALNKVDRHTLQAMAVALAALTPIEEPGVTRYLRSLAGGGNPAAGLARLVPTRETSDGVPLSALDQIEADDETESETDE